jgi:hypothetical protein
MMLSTEEVEMLLGRQLLELYMLRKENAALKKSIEEMLPPAPKGD